MRKVAVIMGSTSDLPVAEKAIQTLEDVDGPRSACYPPTGARTRQENLQRRHGKADFLVSSRSRAWPRTWPARWPRIRRLPVIGVPCSGAKLDGMDAML